MFPYTLFRQINIDSFMEQEQDRLLLVYLLLAQLFKSPILLPYGFHTSESWFCRGNLYSTMARNTGWGYGNLELTLLSPDQVSMLNCESLDCWNKL